jgi:uncharacterized protein YdaL
MKTTLGILTNSPVARSGFTNAILSISATAALFFNSTTAFSDETTNAIKALVLYDSHPPSLEGKLAFTYAIMLRNLIGHFNMQADLQPIESYVPGETELYAATFYLGSYFDNPVPAAFKTDVMKTQQPVVWFKYNLWQIAWDPTIDFVGKFGFRLLELRGMNSIPTATDPEPGFFDTVLYKGKLMSKYYKFIPATNEILADPDLGVTQIADITKAVAISNITNTKTSEQTPYIVRSGNFWYLGDIPLSYIGPRDRYLAFCDVLHDILGINHATSHQAMIRLEDVGANVDPTAMIRLTDYLYSKSIPFSVAAIPFYRDPLGRYNGGVKQEIHLNRASDLKSSLNYTLARGGAVLIHGYTHQYDATPNLHTAVSGDDFEFWNAIKNEPVIEDSTTWVNKRLNAGINEFNKSGYLPFGWETPHYQGSPISNRAFAKKFTKTYQRVVYYSAEKPKLDPNNPNRDFMAGQFFPYTINTDYYGQRILPENLGNIEYDISDIDPTSNIVYTWQDLLVNADYALVVRDGFASFFFHPFWIENELSYLNAFSDLQQLVDGITEMGYQWVGAKNL